MIQNNRSKQECTVVSFNLHIIFQINTLQKYYTIQYTYYFYNILMYFHYYRNINDKTVFFFKAEIFYLNYDGSL